MKNFYKMIDFGNIYTFLFISEFLFLSYFFILNFINFYKNKDLMNISFLFCLIIDEFLGEATIYMEDIRKTMSCRQIIPLQTPGSMEYQVGSLTVEV